MEHTKLDGRITHLEDSETFFSAAKKKEWDQTTKYIRKHLHTREPQNTDIRGYRIIPVRVGHAIQYQYTNGGIRR